VDADESVAGYLHVAAPAVLAVGALLIAWQTVSMHVWRAISIDPVKTLSSE
jgi:hypothetical protein